MSYVPGQRYYFATWLGYQPPVKPHNAIDYETAQASQAFSIFTFDANGRVATFEKWLAVTTPADASALNDRSLSVGIHFFAVAAGAGEDPDGALTLEETRDRVHYFRAMIEADGTPIRLERVRRERMIRHEYTYWENGELRESRSEPVTSPDCIERYDRSGRRLN